MGLGNAQTLPVKRRKVCELRGFYQYASAFWALIQTDISTFHKYKKLYICGHSLGGAGALIVSALLKQYFSPKTLRLYTYGMPRTGTHSFVGAYNDITHYRHVNNHDLVPQVPFKWANTNPDETSNSSKLSSLVLDLVVDNDDDNYHHHGNLVQLLTYSREKFQPQEVKQVLLTPKQTHITSLTFARNTQDDTFILADTLSKEHIDINGYKATILDSGLQHMMSEYIPNLKSQLKILLHGTLSQSYTNANTELTATIDNLNQAIQTLQEEYKQSKNISLRAIKKRRSLKLEEETITKLLANLKRIQRELGGLVNSPTVLPPGVLLYGDKQPLQIDLEGRING